MGALCTAYSSPPQVCKYLHREEEEYLDDGFYSVEEESLNGEEGQRVEKAD